jgi:hypothetical protein
MVFFLTTISSSSCKGSDAIIKNVILSSGLDKNNQPVGITDTFLMDQKVIYCFLTVENVKNPTEVSTQWFLIQSDQEVKAKVDLGHMAQTINSPTNISFGFRQELDNLLPRGKYEIDIFLDHQPAKTTYFFVEMPPISEIEITEHSIKSPNPSDIKRVSYSFSHKGIPFTMNLDIPTSLYHYYSLKTQIATIDPRIYSLYVSHPEDDEYI